MGEKEDKEYYDEINKLNYDYLELFDSEDDKQIYDELIGEILLDALDLKITPKYREVDLYYYISKYSIFIYHFEQTENFEYCAEIRRMGIALLSDSFSRPRVEILEMFEVSINSFRESANNM